MEPTWAGVVRVSHMGARKAGAADFHSERDQVAAMQEAIAKEGGRLELLPPELDVSGGLPIERRPSLRQAVAGVESGKYCGIAIAYQSRLGREVEQEEAVWRRVEAAGGRIIMAIDGLDTSTVDGRMVRRVRSAINAAERERHTEQFARRTAGAVAAGMWKFRQRPLGYDRDPDTRRLIPNDRAGDVTWAFRARACGVSVSVIAARLQMTTSGVRAMLRNRVYRGEIRIGDHEPNLAAHQALVTEDEFMAAQRAVPRPPRGPAGKQALLTGLVRCASCGHTMTRRSAGAHAAYQCGGRSSAGACPGPAGISAANLDAAVERIGRGAADELAVRAREGHRDVDDARKRVERATAELAAYLDAVSVVDVGKEEFARSARRRREEVERAETELQRQLAMRPDVPDGVDPWDAMTIHQRNAFLRGLLAAVVVRKVGRGRRVPLEDRVRVLVAGAKVDLPRRRAGVAAGILPIVFADLDGDDVIGVLLSPDEA